MSVNYWAAWVPDMEDDGELLSSLEVEWIEHECADQGAGGLLVTPPPAHLRLPAPHSRFYAAPRSHAPAISSAVRRRRAGPELRAGHEPSSYLLATGKCSSLTP